MTQTAQVELPKRAPLDLGEWMKTELEFNKKIVSAGEELYPRWVGQSTDGKIYVFATPWTDEDDKRRHVAHVRAMFAIYDIERYLFSAEAWVARQKGDKPLDCMPSEHPDRTEALIVVAVDRHAPMECSVPLTRDENGKVSFGEPIVCTQIEGRMASLLPDPGRPQVPVALREKVAASVRDFLGLDSHEVAGEGDDAKG